MTEMKASTINKDDSSLDAGSSLSCCQKFRFFIKQSWKDIGRHKCQFCLSFCSVFIVVLSILIVVTITSLGPIIFLSLAEKSVGEYDAIFASEYGGDIESFDEWFDTGYYLDYSKAK